MKIYNRRRLQETAKAQERELRWGGKKEKEKKRKKNPSNNVKF